MNRSRIKGVTLIELMVAMGIGLFLSFAGLAFYAQLKERVNAIRLEDRLQSRARLLASHLEYITKDAGYTGCLTGEDYNQGGILAKRDEYQQPGALNAWNEIDSYYFMGPKRFNISKAYSEGNQYPEFFSVTSLMRSRNSNFYKLIPIASARNVDPSGWMSVSSYEVPHTSKIYTSRETCEPFRKGKKYAINGSLTDNQIVDLYERILQTTGYKYGSDAAGNEKELFVFHRYNISDRDGKAPTMQRLETDVENFEILIGIASNSEDPYVREYVSPEQFRLLEDKNYANGKAPQLVPIDSPTLKPTYLIRSVKYTFTLNDPYGVVAPITMSRVVRLNNPRFEDPDKVY